MKILMIHPHDIYSTNEPWTIRIVSIAKELAKAGNKVKLAYFPLPKHLRGKLRIEKITEFETIPLKRRLLSLIPNIIKFTKLGRWADVIHFQKCFYNAALPALFSSVINDKPIHYDWDDWEYGIYLWSPPSKLYGKYLDFIEKSLPKLVDSISVSSDELGRMAREYGYKGKIIKANVCADPEIFKPREKDMSFLVKYNIMHPVVAYMGQLHGAQYIEVFLNAAKYVSQKEKKVQFMVIGGGSELEKTKERAKKLGLQIIFTDFLNQENVVKALSCVDVAVAVFDDNMQVRCKSPLKIAEYLASGKAIVSSDVGEAGWMIGDAGYLVRPKNIDLLGETIHKLVKDKKLRAKFEKKAFERSRLIRWESVAGNLAEKYSEIIRIH